MIFALLLGAWPVAAEPSYCTRNGMGVNAEGKEASPFIFIDYVITSVTGIRAACGADTSIDREFWRNYYRYKGCSDDSFIGKTMMKTVEKTIARSERQGQQAKTSNPEKLASLCRRVDSCIMPSIYPPPDDGTACIGPNALK
ncbi:MAG: hypothetical protein ACPGRZ_10655 [Alphaproteobacteria bacterium]